MTGRKPRRPTRQLTLSHLGAPDALLSSCPGNARRSGTRKGLPCREYSEVYPDLSVKPREAREFPVSVGALGKAIHLKQYIV